MLIMANNLNLVDCTIVWLCPLEVELRAAIAMLDRVGEDLPQRARGQNVIYILGEIGHHKVAVVGYYQEQGLGVSGSMAAEVLRDIPNLQMGLLVGIAGGLPSPNRNIQLGDVAVAIPEGDRPGVVGYDLGKIGENESFELKHWQNATHPLLRSIINIIRAQNESNFIRHLGILEKRPEFERPKSPLIVVDCGTNEEDHPKVHYGTILSGNSVIKSQAKRDALRDKYGAIAVEMEAAGMMTRLPVAVIRGISDFADASKNDAWQPYAAITAAAYAKEILTRLPVEQNDSTQPSQTSSIFLSQDARLAQSLPERWAFVGREEDLRYLEEQVGFPDRQPLQRYNVGLWGLTGVGKSQLTARFVSDQRSKHPEREIFWITGDSREALEQSVVNMLKVGNGPVSSDNAPSVRMSQQQRSELVNSFFAELRHLEDARWLLIIDGISTSFDICDYVNTLKRGYIVFISKRKDLVEQFYPYREIRGLSTENVVDLFRQQVDHRLTEAGGIEELAELLKGLPLSLRLAISTISRYRYTVVDYLYAWKDSSANTEFLGIEATLSRSMELSFQELETTDPIAVKILTLFSFLCPRDLWYDLCLNADEEIFPNWLRDVATQRKSFRSFHPALADLSFIELRSSSNGDYLWETHPAIQVAARQRAVLDEQEYVRCAVSLVAAQVPRSYEEKFWETMLRLEPHADQCWNYIERGKLGAQTNLTDLECLGRLFRHVGRYDRAVLIYQMIEKGLSSHELNQDTGEFLADVLTNLGLVCIGLRKFDLAFSTFQRSWNLQSQLGILSLDASMSLMYNQAIVFMSIGNLDEAEKYLRSAAAHFGQQAANQKGIMRNEQKRLYIRILNDIGEVLLRKDSVVEAKNLLYHILDSNREVLGAAHPTIVSIKLNLGRTHTKLCDFLAARNMLEEVIVVYTEWWGRRHPDTMRAVDELALAVLEEGKSMRLQGMPSDTAIDNAEELWNEVLSFYHSVYGDESDMTDRIRLNLQHLYSVKRNGSQYDQSLMLT